MISQTLPFLLGAATLTTAIPLSTQSLSSHLLPRAEAEFACFNISLPNITIYATGGTIAGSSADSSNSNSGYTPGAVAIQGLIDAVPALCDRANIRGVQVTNVGSSDMTSHVLVNMSQLIQQDLESDYTQGVVFTHGTDTLEETSFFLDSTVQSEKPVVGTAAMRPGTAISADGPINLLNSVTLAASKEGMGRGTMMVLNDRIGSARYTTKLHANAPDTFQAIEQGYLGMFLNTRPVFWYPPARPLGYHHFDISKASVAAGLPRVDILLSHQDFNGSLVQAAVDYGAKGVVLAGTGDGNFANVADEVIVKVYNETGTPMVWAHGVPLGYGEAGAVGMGGGFLDAKRCRLQLMLALETGLEEEATREIFEYMVPALEG